MASLDIFGAIATTGTAAVVVGVIAAVYPGTLAERVRIVGALAIWFGVVVVLTTLGVFDPVRGFGVPALGLAIIVPMVVIAFVVMSSGERFAGVMAMPMPALIATHVLRVLGLMFLLLWSD